jgi:uncharacterized protein (TIGR02466 family)
MGSRTLFATRFYEEMLEAPGLVEELEEACRLLAAEDEAGRRWSRAHAYRGYTSYASLNDLPQRDPAVADLVRHLNRHVSAFAAECAFDLGGRRLKLDSLWVKRPEAGRSAFRSHPSAQRRLRNRLRGGPPRAPAC